MARSGRTVDIKSIQTVVLPEITLTWNGKSQVDNVVIQTATNPNDPDDSAMGVGFEAAEADIGTAVVDAAVGTGLVATFSGATYMAGQCFTSTNARGKLTYCFNKYKVTETNGTYDFYFFDRWATAVGNSGTPLNQVPTVIDIRTKPRPSGHNINALLDYAPRNAVHSCNTVVTLSAGVSGFSASIPISECDDISPNPNATTKTMKVVYDQGALFSGRTHAAEMGVVYRTNQGKQAYTAHYNYTEICRGTYLTCNTITATVDGW